MIAACDCRTSGVFSNVDIKVSNDNQEHLFTLCLCLECLICHVMVVRLPFFIPPGFCINISISVFYQSSIKIDDSVIDKIFLPCLTGKYIGALSVG